MLALFIVTLIWSGINPVKFSEWLIEVSAVVIPALILVLLTYKRFTFSSLSYLLIFAFAEILVIGAHYTYTDVPMFLWIRDQLGWARNDYDRLAHLFQGITPVILTREVLIRKGNLNSGAWTGIAAIAIAMGMSGVFEILEWLVTIYSPVDMIASQGETFDTQIDMFMALAGSIAAILLFRGIHDQQLEGFKQKRL